MTAEAPSITHRGHKAARELAEVDWAFDTMRSKAIDKLLRSKASDADVRDEIIKTVQVIDAVRAHLNDMIAKGKSASDYDEFAEKHKGGGAPV